MLQLTVLYIVFWVAIWQDICALPIPPLACFTDPLRHPVEWADCPRLHPRLALWSRRPSEDPSQPIGMVHRPSQPMGIAMCPTTIPSPHLRGWGGGGAKGPRRVERPSQLIVISNACSKNWCCKAVGPNGRGPPLKVASKERRSLCWAQWHQELLQIGTID